MILRSDEIWTSKEQANIISQTAKSLVDQGEIISETSGAMYDVFDYLIDDNTVPGSISLVEPTSYAAQTPCTEQKYSTMAFIPSTLPLHFSIPWENIPNIPKMDSLLERVI